MNELTSAELKFIVARVLENAQECSEEAKENPTDFENGRKMAYYEILDTIKNELTIREIDLKEFGLDIILEKLI